MGGLGSGRHGATPTIESTASYVLDIKSLAGAFQTGQRVRGAIRFDGGRFPVVVTVDLTNEWNCFVELVDLTNEWNCFVELIHPTRDEQQRVPIITDRVRLTSTEPTFGGRRWWFLCPRTARRTTKLFLPNGGSHFWSRQAYGLGYRCQREDQIGRGGDGLIMRNLVTGHSYTGPNGASSSGILIFGGCGDPLTTGVRIVKNVVGSSTPADGNDIGVALANYDPTCMVAPTTATNNKVINNTITNTELTNNSGNGATGYQAGVHDSGDNDKVINNDISGVGYDPSKCSPLAVPRETCAVDSSSGLYQVPLIRTGVPSRAGRLT
jgi:hypothetical protein